MKHIKFYLLFLPFFFLLCSCGNLNENSSLEEVIWTIIGWIALIGVIEAVFDMIFSYFAVKLPYIYFPACLAFAIVMYFKISKGDFTMFGLEYGIYIGHAILLFLMIPRFDDFVQHYTRISYEYDVTIGDFVETAREDVKKTVSGICLKLGTVAALLAIFFVLPTLIYKQNDPAGPAWIAFCPLIVEGVYCGIFSLIGLFRLIRYHR